MNKIDEILYLIYQEDVLPKSITVKVSDLQEISRQTNALKVAAKEVIKQWNSLPKDIEQLRSFHMFGVESKIETLAALLDGQPKEG